MRRWYLMALLLVLTDQMGLAQTSVEANTSGTNDRFSIYDVNGKPWRNKDYQDVEGTPFVNENWKVGNLLLTSGKTLSGVRIRINVFSNEVHFLSVNNEEFSTPIGTVKQVRVIDSTQQPPAVALFQCGYPAIEDLGYQNFYEVVSEGRASLLKSESKKIQERKNEMSGEVRKEFAGNEDYYVFQNGSMKRLKKEKSFVMELMTDQKEKVEAFTASQKINFRNPQSLKKLFDYYNSL